MPASAREEIENTLHRYALGYDEHNWTLVADCFTSDAVLSMRIADGELIGPFQGGDSIVSMMRDAAQTQVGQRRHVTNNLIIDVTGTTATSMGYLTLFLAHDGAATLLSTGKYEDELVHTDAGWKLATRHIALDLPY